ncbi:MAG: T9SS type A sorting domain-containing protein [Bacteroidota bacterium]
MKYLITIIGLCFLLPFTKAQNTVTFTYDSNGNQYRLRYNSTNARSAPENSDSEDTMLTEISEEVDFKDLKLNKEELNKQILLFPNPTNGEVRLQFNGDAFDQILGIQIFDQNGRLLQTFDQKIKTLDFTNFSKGVYIVRFLIKNNELITREIIRS